MSETAMELLTPREVARRLKLSPRTVVVWLQTGRLPGVKVGKQWRVRDTDLESFLIDRAKPSPELDPETRDWLEADLASPLPPYDWGPGGPPKGRRVWFEPGQGILVERDDES